MYFEQQPWFKRQNFRYDLNPLVVTAYNFTITATMNVKPQADVVVTIENNA